MWKYILVGFFSVILLFSVTLFVSDKFHKENLIKLNNTIAEQQKIQQETETGWSKLAIQSDKIEIENKDLQKIIKDRDEKILSLSQTNLKLQDQYLKILDSKQSIVDENDNEVNSGIDCLETKKYRYKVDFEQKQNNFTIKGFTLTNPAYTELHLKWTEPLVLSLILTKKDNTYRVYINPKDKTVVPTDLKLEIDPNLFNEKWYEKFFILTDIGISTQYDIVPSGKISYVFDLTNSVQVNPYFGVSWYIKEMKLLPVFGTSLIWYPFKR